MAQLTNAVASGAGAGTALPAGAIRSAATATPSRPHRGAISYLLEILRLGRSQRWAVAIFAALSLASSFVQLLGLLCFSAGFAVTAEGAQEVHGLIDWAIPLLEASGLARSSWWLVFFLLFVLLALAAASLTHMTWIVRLRLLALFEAELMFRGLSLITHLDPRDRVDMTRRQMLFAVRSDCKSARVVFQLLLLIVMSLMTISLPLWYMFSLRAEMVGLGLTIALAGFLPVYLIGKKAAGMSFERQDVSMEAGTQVSGLLATLQEGDLEEAEIERLIGDVRTAIGRQHVLWRQQYEMRSLCQQIPIAFSILGTLAILVWGAVETTGGELSWGELFTMVVASRIVFGPLAQIGNRWVKTAEHVPRAIRHLDFIHQHADLPSLKTSWVALRPDEPRRAIEEVRFDGLRLPGEHEKDEHLDLVVRRGSILTIVDPAIDDRNPLIQWLSAEQYVREGSILFDGIDVNTLQYDAIKQVVGYPPRQLKQSGSVLECFQAAAPDSDRQDVEDFCRLILGDRYREWMPEGIDTLISPQAKRTEKYVRGIYHLQELFDFARSGKSVLLADFFSMGNPARRFITLRFCRLLRDSFITVWMDTAPRAELGAQQVATFRDGRFLGLGDLTWFESTIPDWDYDIAPTVSRKGDDEVNEGTIEAMEGELLVEEA